MGSAYNDRAFDASLLYCNKKFAELISHLPIYLTLLSSGHTNDTISWFTTDILVSFPTGKAWFVSVWCDIYCFKYILHNVTYKYW